MKSIMVTDGRFFFISSRIPLVLARCGIKKNRSKNLDRIGGTPHQNDGKRKGQSAAKRAINVFLMPIRLVRTFIEQVHLLTGIPDTNLRRWQGMIAEDPEWRVSHTRHGEH
jgi:hypothetical protein